jgi:hypothetical protein
LRPYREGLLRAFTASCYPKNADIRLIGVLFSAIVAFQIMFAVGMMASHPAKVRNINDRDRIIGDDFENIAGGLCTHYRQGATKPARVIPAKAVSLSHLTSSH